MSTITNEHDTLHLWQAQDVKVGDDVEYGSHRFVVTAKAQVTRDEIILSGADDIINVRPTDAINVWTFSVHHPSYRTPCCGATTTITIDDGALVCRHCYADVWD